MTNPFLKYTSEQAAQHREAYLRDRVLPIIQRNFKLHPRLRSAAFLVAQWYDDEAYDAIHFTIYYSELPTPDLLAPKPVWQAGDPDHVNLPGGRIYPPWPAKGDAAARATWDAYQSQRMADYDIMFPDSISLFAAFCNGDHPDSVDPWDTWEPFAIFRRLHDDSSGEIDTEIVGTMLRPWLDGVMATYEAIRNDEDNLDVWIRMRDELWPKPPS